MLGRHNEEERNVNPKTGIERGIWWIIFRGSRLAVASGIFLGFILFYLAIASTGIFVIGTSQRLLWLMNGIINGMLTLVTVVIAVNQLILTQEFGPVGEQHDQIETMIKFREHVEEKTGLLVSPPQPAAFLSRLFQALSEHTYRLQEESEEIAHTDQQLHEMVEEYVDQFGEQLNETATQLDNPHADLFVVFSVILTYDNSEQLYATRQLEEEYGTVLSKSMTETLEEIRELLIDLDTSRQYFKTTYIQRELAELSRRLIYAGLFSVGVTGIVILSVQRPTSFQISVDLFATLASIIVAVTLLPLFLLVAYILRIATVARQTAAFGSFILE